MMKNWKQNVALFLASQAISLFGSLLVQYAITWHITLSTQSGAMMTVAIICGFVPTLFLSPFAGVWADRYNRKLLIALSDALIATSTLILAILFFIGYDSIWLLFVASAVRALGAGVQTPAIGAFLPQITPEDQLTRVNATNTTIQSLVGLISPMLAGALLTVASIEAIFLIDVVTAAIAIVILIFFLHAPLHAKALSGTSVGYLTDLREGFRYIVQHDFLKVMFLFNAAFFILAAPVAFLTPLQVARSFGDEVWRLTAIEVAFSVGMTGGGILMAIWGGFRNKVHSMSLSNILVGTFTLLLGLRPAFWLYVIFMGVIGVAMPIFNTPATVLLQQKVDGDYLGRVFGISSMMASSLMPLAMLVFGPVADAIPIEWLLVGTGVLLVGQATAMLLSRALIEAGKPTLEQA